PDVRRPRVRRRRCARCAVRPPRSASVLPRRRTVRSRNEGTVAAVARPRGAKARAASTVELLRELYPDAKCALDHSNAYELLAATILSAQSTDVRVNMVTPTLFAKYPTPADLASADPAEVESIIQSTGFFRSKSKSLIGIAQAVVSSLDVEITVAIEDLVLTIGCGRRIAHGERL